MHFLLLTMLLFNNPFWYKESVVSQVINIYCKCSINASTSKLTVLTLQRLWTSFQGAYELSYTGGSTSGQKGPEVQGGAGGQNCEDTMSPSADIPSIQGGENLLKILKNCRVIQFNDSIFCRHTFSLIQRALF